jgi:two-component system nitrogen regulation response regulator GlnG
MVLPAQPVGRGTGSARPDPKGIIGIAAHRRIRVLRPGAVIMGRVLLVDDDPAMTLDQVTHALRPQGMRVEAAHTAEEGLRQVAAQPPDVILLDVHLPDLSGLEAYQRIRQIDARIPVIFITWAATADTAIEAMKEGAYDYLFKPLDLALLRGVVAQALELGRLMRRPAVVAETPPAEDAGDAIIGRCPAMAEVYKAIGRVAAQNVIVLITGESGTGKELVARAIYQHSARARAPFLAINCAAIPENLLESELFGHEKGAFTGADRKRIGKFEQWSGGTIFLDEIGDMPLATQAKILRLLQDQSFERVGGNETVRTDVRLIAATHRDLKAWSAEGKFRQDLYYRLSVFTIPLPALRERGDDLPMLVLHYLRRFSRELGRQVGEIAPEALELLRRYPWPGNIRELQGVLKQALLQATGTVLIPAFLPDFLRAPPATAAGPDAAADADFSFEALILRRIEEGSTALSAEAHQQLDRLLLRLVLRSTRGNQVQAARVLGISRQTLRTRLRELGLSTGGSAEGEADDRD